MAGAEKPGSKGQAWFCTTGLPSDIVVEVADMSFHLHKFPLMSKSRWLHQRITEEETNPTERPEDYEGNAAGDGDGDGHEIEEIECHITLPADFPGGCETFEIAAKFCYGVKIDLNASNAVPLRCAGEVLEMTEEYSADNLISKTEGFLSQSVLRSLKDSIKALKSCERLMPLAETLGLTELCIDSITSRASSADPALFGWPVNDGAKESRSSKPEILWNGIETGGKRRNLTRAANAEPWFEDLALLDLPFFNRVISTMRARDLQPEIIESCLIYYAKKHIPGISRSNNRKPSSSSSSSIVNSESEQRELLETIISNLPSDRGSSRSPSPATRFLFGLLRTANILNASEACRAALEKKIGSQLEQATLDDLLIPSYSYLNETLYDVDCVERILSYFLRGLEGRNQSDDADNADGELRSPALMLVGKLIDGYLSEIASDANLKPDRFYNLAISLPDQARLFDDGLYRAVDVYLKAHPWISEEEREKICGVMDCQKLTLEACTHAAQNERLPLRAVVQVLFFEQLQLRHAIAGTLLAAETAPQDHGRPSVIGTRRVGEGGEEEEEEREEDAGVLAQRAEGGERTWVAAVRENQVLRLDMDSMRTRVHQLERECSTMKKVIEKIDTASPTAKEGRRRGGSKLGKKFGCKFKTQVCDSHEPTVADAPRKGRRNQHQQ